jgi:RNA polymerase-binding transcription factor DksA
MDKTFIEKMKNTLLESRKQLLDQLMASNAEFRQILEDMESKDVIDVAADAMDRKLLETMGTQDLNRLKLMDNALARIEQG